MIAAISAFKYLINLREQLLPIPTNPDFVEEELEEHDDPNLTLLRQKKNGLRIISKQEFKRRYQETTKTQLSKLFASRKFKETSREKGITNPEKWNWQAM